MSGNFDFGQSGDLRGGGFLLRALLQSNDQQLIQQLTAIERTEQLQEIQDQFQGATQNMTPRQLAALMRSGAIPASLSVSPPDLNQQIGANQYAPPQDFGVAGNSPFAKYLREHPDERALLEMELGGRIVSTADGTLQVQPFPPGAFNGGGANNDLAFSAMSMLAAMQRAAGSRDGADFAAENTFHTLLMNAMANVLMGQGGPSGQVGPYGQGGPSGQIPFDPSNPNSFQALRALGHSPFVDWSEDSPENARRRNAQAGGAQTGGAQGGPALMAGGPGGSYQDFAMGGPGGGGGGDTGAMGAGPSLQGFNSPTQGSFGISPGGGDEVGAVLNDPGLTVEDKVTLMIMLIMKKMDQDIERQANYINSLQQQQNGGGAGANGGGGANGAPGGGGAPSIDVETMKLKRLIDKRSQMFDMLRQIIDKYNQTAKGIIDSIGR